MVLLIKIGLKKLISFYNNGQVPRGLGRTVIVEALPKEYYTKLQQNRDKIQTLIKGEVVHTGHKFDRILQMQHDSWSSKCNDAYLGINISFIDVKGKFIVNHLACKPVVARIYC